MVLFSRAWKFHRLLSNKKMSKNGIIDERSSQKSMVPIFLLYTFLFSFHFLLGFLKQVPVLAVSPDKVLDRGIDEKSNHQEDDRKRHNETDWK